MEDDQSDELCEIVTKIEDYCKDEVESIFHEADVHSKTTGEPLRSSWEHDKASNKTKLFKDQLKNSKLHDSFVGMILFLLESGSVGKRWSLITIRIGTQFNVIYIYFSVVYSTCSLCSESCCL